MSDTKNILAIADGLAKASKALGLSGQIHVFWSTSQFAEHFERIKSGDVVVIDGKVSCGPFSVLKRGDIT